MNSIGDLKKEDCEIAKQLLPTELYFIEMLPSRVTKILSLIGWGALATFLVCLISLRQLVAGLIVSLSLMIWIASLRGRMIKNYKEATGESIFDFSSPWSIKRFISGAVGGTQLVGISLNLFWLILLFV